MSYLATYAVLSDDKLYRYLLGRRLTDGDRTIVFVGLNPSTADATEDDPTVRREVAYARAWGFDVYLKVNLYAFRSTDPRVLRTLTAKQAMGPMNPSALAVHTAKAELVLCAWGKTRLHAPVRDIAGLLMKMPKARHLKLNSDGSPAHSLYLKKDLVPLAW